MPTPIEAYRAGYEKARQDDLGGTLAEVTMGMLRDDPGGHFAAGYHDGAGRKKFNPPSIPTPSRPKTDGLIPKFSENPFGWFLGVIIVVEFWTLWQLIKAPFQLIGALMRSEKPSPSVIVRNVIVAGLAIALMWWIHNAKEMQATSAAPVSLVATSPPAARAAQQRPSGRFEAASKTISEPSGLFSVSVTDDGSSHTARALINGTQLTLNDSDLSGRWAIFSYNRPHDVIILMCPNGATFVGASSSTGNSVSGPALGYGNTEITSGKPNNLTIQCRK